MSVLRSFATIDDVLRLHHPGEVAVTITNIGQRSVAKDTICYPIGQEATLWCNCSAPGRPVMYTTEHVMAMLRSAP